MNNLNKKKRLIAAGILIGIGIIGVAMFFPVNIDSNYTCLYHRMFSSTQGDDTAFRNMNMNHQNMHHPGMNHYSQEMMSENQPENLVHRYVLPFGFLWWISVSVVFIGILFIKKVNRVNFKQNRGSIYED